MMTIKNQLQTWLNTIKPGFEKHLYLLEAYGIEDWDDLELLITKKKTGELLDYLKDNDVNKMTLCRFQDKFDTMKTSFSSRDHPPKECGPMAEDNPRVLDDKVDAAAQEEFWELPSRKFGQHNGPRSYGVSSIDPWTTSELSDTNPSSLDSSKQSNKRKLEIPLKPKKATNAYFLFSIDHKAKIYAENFGISKQEVNQLTSEAWRSLPQDKKVPYQEKYEEGRKKYFKEKEEYNKKLKEMDKKAKKKKTKGPPSLDDLPFYPSSLYAASYTASSVNPKPKYNQKNHE